MGVDRDGVWHSCAHNLEIEKGRHIGVKTEDRIFKLCNTGVEDETQFLLQCPVLEILR